MVDFAPQLLRMRNLYGGQDSPLNTPEPFTGPNPIEAENPVDETNTRLNSGLEGESKFKTPYHHEVADKFLEFLDTYPEKPKKAGIMGNIAGIASALVPGNKPEDVDKARFGGYYRGRDEWKERAGVLSTAANLERSTNAQTSLDEDRRENREYRNANLERMTREDASEARAREAKAATDRKRVENQTAALDSGHIVSDRSGNMKMVITKGPRMGQIVDLGIDDLSYSDKLKMVQDGRMTIVNDQQEAARELARIRHQYEEEEITRRAEEQRKTNEAKVDDKELKPNEIKQQRLNRIAEYVRNHQEQEDWIQEGENGVIAMRPPKAWTEATAKRYQKAISDFNAYVDQGASDTGTGAIPGANTGKIDIFNGVDAGPDGKVIGPPKKPDQSRFNRPNITQGPTPPPLASRKVGDKHTFTEGASKGKTGTWDGSSWDLGGK